MTIYVTQNLTWKACFISWRLEIYIWSLAKRMPSSRVYLEEGGSHRCALRPASSRFLASVPERGFRQGTKSGLFSRITCLICTGRRSRRDSFQDLMIEFPKKLLMRQNNNWSINFIKEVEGESIVWHNNNETLPWKKKGRGGTSKKVKMM